MATASMALGNTIFSRSRALLLPPERLRSIINLLLQEPSGLVLTMMASLEMVPCEKCWSTCSFETFITYPRSRSLCISSLASSMLSAMLV